MDNRPCFPGLDAALFCFCASASSSQKYLISIALDRCRFIVLFTIPTAVVLLTCMGMGGCLCPISSRMICIIFASWALRNSAPSLASAAEAATSFSMAQVIMTLPLSLIGSPSFGKLPRKNIRPLGFAHLLLSSTKRQSECLKTCLKLKTVFLHWGACACSPIADPLVPSCEQLVWPAVTLSRLKHAKWSCRLHERNITDYLPPSG